MAVDGRECLACGEFKPWELFHLHPRGFNGRQSRCRACKSVENRAYKARERGAIEARRKARYAANPALGEADRKRVREWEAADKERYKASQRRAYERKRTEKIAAAKAWREANPERYRELVRARRAADPEKFNEYSRRYRAYKAGAPVEEIIPGAIYERDGGMCGICGHPTEPDDFHIDHVIPLSRGGPHTVENLQVAHPLCNLRKGARLPSELAA